MQTLCRDRATLSKSTNLKVNKNKSVLPYRDKISNSNKIHLKKENVRVIVRIRPVEESNCLTSNCVKVIDEGKTGKKHIILEDPRHRGLPKRYEFDEVYDIDSTTESIYSEEIEDFVHPLLSECSCINVFAFGSSGTGKTYTMHGEDDNNLGIVGLTIKQLIELNDNQSIPGKFSFSFFEVYCEKIQDLLSGIGSLSSSDELSSNSKLPNASEVYIRTDICGRVRVVGTKNFEFSSWDEFNGVYREALKRRVSGKTAMNSSSSRSHACIQINYIPPIVDTLEENKGIVGNEDTLENRKRRGSISFHVKPKVDLNYPRTIVNLVDLSGFENNKITNNTGKRMVESTFINSSLLSLSKVINALKRNGGTQSVQSCIPYRESKLTRLLQEYLGGGADPPYSPYCLRCIMICTISPSVAFFQQTYATLNTPSYGNTSIMKKFVGIVGSGFPGDKKSTFENISVDFPLNNLSRDTARTNRGSSLAIRTGTKEKKSFVNDCSGKLISTEGTNNKNWHNKTSASKNLPYNKIESRVAQMIKGKIPFHSNSKFSNVTRVKMNPQNLSLVSDILVKRTSNFVHNRISDIENTNLGINSNNIGTNNDLKNNETSANENTSDFCSNAEVQYLSNDISALNISESLLEDNSTQIEKEQLRSSQAEDSSGSNREILLHSTNSAIDFAENNFEPKISQESSNNQLKSQIKDKKKGVKKKLFVDTESKKEVNSQIKVLNRPVTRSQTKKE